MRSHIRMRENWYRDVWLLIVSATCVIAVYRSVGTADQATRTVNAVQRSRVEVTVDNCRETNGRHDATIAELRQLYGHPLSSQQDIADALRALTGIEQGTSDQGDQAALDRAAAAYVHDLGSLTGKNFQSTVLLINALAPKRDCAEVGRELERVPGTSGG